MKSIIPPTATQGRLETRQRRFRDALADLCTRLENEVGPLVGSLFPGEVRSKHRALHGLERDTPDIFRPGDDAQQIDLRHLPATLAYHPVEVAIIRQELRRARFAHYSDTELILVLDLSRSMLTGCLREEGPPATIKVRDKLWGLYLATSIFLTLGEQAGFVLRVVFARDGTGESERALQPHDFRFRVLDRASTELLDSYDKAEKLLESSHQTRTAPLKREKLSLKFGLEAALEVRARSVLVVVSDFLDPLTDDAEAYENELFEAATRHHLVLVDVANDLDVQFPMPIDFWSMKFRRYVESRNRMDQQWCDVLRLVERDMRSRTLNEADISHWNETIAARRAELQRMLHRFGADFCERFRDLDVPRALALATNCLGVLGR